MDSIDRMQSDIEEMRRQLGVQRNEIESLKKKLRDHQIGGESGAVGERDGRSLTRRRRISRASWLKAAAAGAATIAGVNAAGATANVEAMDGQPIVAGAVNTTNGTILNSLSGGRILWYVDQSNSSVTPPAGLLAPLQGIGLGNGDGVNGFSPGPAGYGVKATSDQGYGAVGQTSSGIDLAALGTGLLYLRPQTSAGPPSTGSFLPGEQLVDGKGNLYICNSGNGMSLGTWQAVGNFRIFGQGHRVYANNSVVTGTTYGPVDATSVNGTATGVPVGATAAYCAVQSYQSGVMTLFADGAVDPGIANWSGPSTNGSLNLLYMFVPLSSAGRFQIHTYLSGSVYVDVWGYVL